MSLAADLKKALGVDAELIAGSGGVFDVEVDGALLYSRHETGVFPDGNALVETIRRRKT